MLNLKEKRYLANFAFKPKAKFGVVKNKKDSWARYLIPLRRKKENISAAIDKILYQSGFLCF